MYGKRVIYTVSINKYTRCATIFLIPSPIQSRLFQENYSSESSMLICVENWYILYFFFRKFKCAEIMTKSTITSIVSKIPAAVLRHALTSPKQLNKIKVICPLISYLLSYTEFFTRKGIKTHFLLIFGFFVRLFWWL